ncbi:unnamed protein product [Periconia digitata]|uniref:GST N-terminal domain-containing protein n=1 Tax=Periconia digitata TaxID=1303443 RepID=A0A9W4XDM1_9PLEO|nr:unnamed protein product [Periconia digitata]
MTTKVVLYDIPSKPPQQAWSLNPWKIRMVLNLKGIDYETVWLEYPDIAPTLKSYGVPPNDRSAPGITADYSSPAIRYEDNTLSMDSWKIVYELEKRYPSPSLHLDDSIVLKIRDHIDLMRTPLNAHLMPKIPRNLLSKESATYFESTREIRFGMPLAQLEEQKANEEAWEKAKRPAEEAADLLKQHGGPYFLGQTVSYADFILVSFLHFVKRIDENVYQRYLDFDPAFATVYEACRQWLVKDD